MNSEIHAELRGSRRLQPVFEGLDVQAELRETLAVTTITQSYRNAGTKNIEVVYTFPLPLDAVLLEMTVTLGDKILQGTVLPKNVAEERYEDAITDGDAPVMLENPQPGAFSMNVGNLLPGEVAKITFRYAMFQRWQGNTLRYILPTTIAPRYGSAARAGFAPHQEPETSLMVDNRFAFSMKVVGRLAVGLIESPSHELALSHDVEGECIISLSRITAFMDRDLVVTVRNEGRQDVSALVVRDGDDYLLWGSFHPQFDLKDDISPRNVKIVVDCSGSMGGDSIAQAKESLHRVIEELRPQDWFNIVAFGNHAKPLFNAQMPADSKSLTAARLFLQKMDADMGGTEIGTALEMAVRLRCPEKIQPDVLLITDGEVWNWEEVVAKAKESHHRFFTVGVGSAVSEAFLRSLAEISGGACELVSPNENMAERIHRHFLRIATPRSSGSNVAWPNKPLRVFPMEVPSIYDGDTCNLFAWFAEPPTGEVKLNVPLPNGTSIELPATICPPATEGQDDGTIPRMAAALRLRVTTDKEAGQELAVQYQLVSRWTNFLAIVIRAEGEKAIDLPELHRVEQMLAAGWGGVGTVQPQANALCFMRTTSLASPASHDRSYNIPTFLRKSAVFDECLSLGDVDEDESGPYANRWQDLFIDRLNVALKTDKGLMVRIRIRIFPAEYADILNRIVASGFDEWTVVITFLHLLAGSVEGGNLTRQAKRVINKAFKELQVEEQIIESITEMIQLEIGFTCDTIGGWLSRKFAQKSAKA